MYPWFSPRTRMLKPRIPCMVILASRGLSGAGPGSGSLLGLRRWPRPTIRFTMYESLLRNAKQSRGIRQDANFSCISVLVFSLFLMKSLLSAFFLPFFCTFHATITSQFFHGDPSVLPAACPTQTPNQI
jgi:hypothetical protein